MLRNCTSFKRSQIDATLDIVSKTILHVITYKRTVACSFIQSLRFDRTTTKERRKEG
ncbi:hypothetical protein CANCADRAFT_96418 [Tortispora caseinolytica NRRL Y-17796]|uniref:Uncharacterized protein n=1 Tax=Tortispora caseinolytica NRRL Y-17796 TaxID=767744 RepID=A0A1E4TMK1_9ASCO|nr:hypothetical protein CANCADRAFT_96418 [Tortispora caseinolytica NRRL Y-17796]